MTSIMFKCNGSPLTLPLSFFPHMVLTHSLLFLLSLSLALLLSLPRTPRPPHPPPPHPQVVYTLTITLKHPIMFCGPTISLKSSISLLSSMRHLIIEFSFPPSYQLRSSAWFLQQAAICGSLGCSCQLLCPVLGICTSICDLLLVLYFPLDFSAQK